MTTTTPNFTIGTALIALQAAAANAVVVGAEVAVTKFSGYALIHFGRTSTSTPVDANGNPSGVNFRIEAAGKSAGAGQWYPIAQYRVNATPASSGTNTSTSGGNQTISSTSGFAPGDTVVVQDGTTANSEWAHVKGVTSSTVLAMEENLVGSHTTGSTFNQAEIVSLGPLDLGGVSRLRCVVDGSSHNQPFICEVYLNTLDSMTTA